MCATASNLFSGTPGFVMKKPRFQEIRGMRRRILVVDDHPMTRYGLVHLIGREPDMVVCGEAEDARQAFTVIKALKPDLVVADITMPGKSGLDFVREVQALNPGLPVLVMSMHDEAIYAERVLRAGGRGYIMKSQGGEKVLEAIRRVLEGEVYVSKRMAAIILDGLTRRGPVAGEPRPGLLSDREFEIFQLLGEGLSSKDIAQRLTISVKTVCTHRVHIKDKLRLATGPDLIQHAVRWAAARQLV
jgi:DNA-binding NarL/FixJ family response regulator